MHTVVFLAVSDWVSFFKNLKKVFESGESLIWGCLGWFLLIALLIWVVCTVNVYVSKYREREKEKSVYIKEKRERESKLQDLDLELRYKATEIDLKREELKGCYGLLRLFQGKKNQSEKQLKELNEEKERIHHNYRKERDMIKRIDRDEENSKKQFEGWHDKFCKRIKGSRKYVVAVIVVVFIDSKNMYVAGQTLVQNVKWAFEAIDEDLPIEGEEKTEEDFAKKENVQESTKTSVVTMPEEVRDNWDYNFILNAEQLDEKMDGNIEKIIFLDEYTKDEEGYRLFLEECKSGRLPEKLADKEVGSGDTVEELLNIIAEDMEKPFLERIEKGKTVQTLQQWERTVPNSGQLETIINTRKEILALTSDKDLRRLIYFRLANDYQRMGIECGIQEKSGEQIYYYYGMSIYCCYCALAYETEEDAYSDGTILNYVVARYKDIADSEKRNVPKDIVDKAATLYEVVLEYEDLYALN